MIFHQLFEHDSSTYTYLLADPDTREAILIDPVIETVERDLKLISDLNLKLKYVLDTHVHADHVTAAGEIRKRTGAQTGVSCEGGVDCVDLALNDGQTLKFGKYEVKALATPGHTNGCMSYYCEGRVFTGDALLVRGTGRTDFQQGSSEKLYDSITQKLFTLPDSTIVMPGHDYRGFTSSTIGEEKRLNPRIGSGKTKAEFVKIMSELKLAHPKKIHEALPANLKCGVVKQELVMRPQMVDGIPEVTCEDVQRHLGKTFIVDVRRPDEFTGELGHVPGSELVELGPDLIQWLESGDRDREIVFTCRSGGRSGQATAISREMGYSKTMNMIGGMIRWNDLGLKVER